MSNFKSTDGYKLRQAIKNLGAVYGVKDSTSFMQILLQGTTTKADAGNASTSALQKASMKTDDSLERLADAILSTRGDGHDIVGLIKEIEVYIGAGKTSGDTLATILKSEPSEASTPPLMITSCNDLGLESGYMRQSNFAKLLGKDQIAATDPQAGIIEMFHPNLNFSNRDTVASSIFLMALPSIEMSKAVPYMDMKVIVKGTPIEDKNGQTTKGTPDVFSNGMSIYKFLNGEEISENTDSIVRTLATAMPVEFQDPPPTLDGTAGTKATSEAEQAAVAGMELFTAPQTMVRGDLQHIDLDASKHNYGPGAEPEDVPLENKVLDKFRPFMTLESMSVQTTPATGMIATTAATVKVKLHDKSRMHEASAFLVPSQLGDVEFLIEYGWSHPQDDPEINPYGALINSMRVKQKYGLMNSSYSFTPQGEVDIQLTLYSKGAQKAAFELVSNDGQKSPAETLKELVRSIRENIKGLRREGFKLNADMGAPDTLGKISSVGGLLTLSDDELKAITKFINNMKKSASRSSADEWKDMSESWTQATKGISSFQAHIKKVFGHKIFACTGKGGKKGYQVLHDPYLKTIEKVRVGTKNVKCVDIGHTTHVSLAKVLTIFVADPIRQTGRFDEVQMLFYPINDKAMFAAGWCLSQYPINKKTLETLFLQELNKTPSIHIAKFLGFIKKIFVDFIGDDIYGLSSAYAVNDEGKRELKESFTKNDAAKQKFAAIKQAVMETCYGEDGQKTFKKPRIQMFVECVKDANSTQKTILRLHFFDRQTTSYSSYAELWAQSSSSELGIIGKYTTATTSLAKAESMKDSVKDKKERKKWEALAKRRNEAKVEYEKLANAQMDEFIANGLLEAFYVKEKKTDENGLTKTVNVKKMRIRGGPDQLRGMLAANMPTLKYGTEFSGILQASLSTNSDPMMETIHMQRQRQGSQPAGQQDAGLPMRIKPVTLQLDTFGCPFINFGQQFFVDFQTNTTIDDIYAVTGISHEIAPGEFKSQIKLSPLNKLGQFTSMTDSFANSVGLIKDVGNNIS